MTTLQRDLRFALRMLIRRPGLTVSAVLCLALGIGATTVIYSLVSAVVLRPLPYTEPERLFMIWGRFPQLGIPKTPASGQEFVDYQDQNQSFETLAGSITWNYNLTGGGEPQRLQGGRVSVGLFALLGAEAALGRTFVPEDETDNEHVVILSHRLWQNRFGADTDVIGRSVSLSEIPYTVVGVMPEGFRFLTGDPDLWVPLIVNTSYARHLRPVVVVGRLKPGVSWQQAQADMDAIAAGFQHDYPGVYPAGSGWGIGLVPIHEEIVGNVRPQLLALFGAVVLVLLIACANVANLLLVQAPVREREVALRTALGASRLAVVRQLLIESLVLAMVGGSLGLLLAYWGTNAVVAFDLGAMPRLEEVGIDWGILGFALAASVATGLLFGLAPALRASRIDLSEAIKEGRSMAGIRRHPLLSLLVASEIALALVVLASAGLMIRTFYNLQQVDPGFRTQDVATLQVYLSPKSYPKGPQLMAFYRRLQEGLEGLPGSWTVGLISDLPLGFSDQRGEIFVEGRKPVPGAPDPEVGWRMINPDYFQAMGIPLLEGRSFNDLDHDQAPGVVIVGSALARRLWPDKNPIGQRLELKSSLFGGWRTVVGVVADVKDRGLAAGTSELLYVPYPQFRTRSLALVIHAAIDPMSATAAVREVIRTADPDLPVASIQTMDELVRMRMSRPRFNRLLFSLFSTVSLLLAAVGVYGVMAHSVAQRTREIGLRIALGARSKDVQKQVLRPALALTLLGVTLGLAMALLLASVFSEWLPYMLYGVGAADPLSFGVIVLLLIAWALAASYLPARRATRIDPMVALREE
ncbi:MAG: ABC transporter permease [Acidobacteriota bacterium]